MTIGSAMLVGTVQMQADQNFRHEAEDRDARSTYQ